MNRWLVMMFALMILASSCTDNKDFTVTKSGLGYKIFPGNSKDSLKPGNFIRFRVVQKIEDSLLNVPDETPEQFIQVPSQPVEFDLMEIANKIKIGDSIVYRLPVDTILAKNQGRQLPPFLKKGKNIFVFVKVLKQYDSAQVATEDRQKEIMRIQQVIADKRMAEFNKIAKDKFSDAVKTKGATLVKITKQGDGPVSDSGKVVTMKYEGRFAKSGEVFDGNMNQKDTALNKPIEFQLVDGGMMKGWMYAMPLLRKGAKASFLIPYTEGYGETGFQTIPPYSNLIFDVEVLDVKDAPQQTIPNLPPPPTKH